MLTNVGDIWDLTGHSVSWSTQCHIHRTGMLELKVTRRGAVGSDLEVT